MAHIPNMNALPNVWSIPNHFEITKIEKGYYIKKIIGPDNTVIEFIGSSKSIAKQLISLLNSSSSNYYKYNDLSTYFIEPFYIYMPELECSFLEERVTHTNINLELVADEITNELKKLKNLLIFL